MQKAVWRERHGIDMMQQISESEAVLMKIIWDNGGCALYSYIMEELEKKEAGWKKNTVLTLCRPYVNTFLTSLQRNEWTGFHTASKAVS